MVMAGSACLTSESVTNVTLNGTTCTDINSSAPNFSDYECQSFSYALPVLAGGYIVVIVVGLFGNVCLIHIIRLKKEAHNVTNLLIASLSLSDVLICVMCIPFTLVYTLMDYWVFGEALCRASNFAQCLSVSVSSFSLALIAVERYQLIANPRGWRPSIAQAYLGIALIWLGSGVLAAPFLVFYHLSDEPFRGIVQGIYRGKYACVDSWPSEWSRLAFTTCLLVMQYFAPLCFIFACYARVFVRLRRHGGRVDRRRDNELKPGEGRRINAILVSIVAAFAVCWLPLNIFNLIFDWHHEALLSCHHNLLFTLCHLVAMVSTCVNPVFYGLLNKNFQKDFGNVLRPWRCRSESEEHSIRMSTKHKNIHQESTEAQRIQ